MSSNGIVGGLIILCVSVVGILANVYVMFSVARKKSLRTSFFFLCGSKALYNFMICLVFLSWCCPTALLHDYWLPKSVGSILGNLAGGCIYLGGIFMQVLASVNRIIAAFSLQAYKKYCGLRTTMVMNVLTWIGTIAITVLYTLMGTMYEFNADYLIWIVSYGDEATIDYDSANQTGLDSSNLLDANETLYDGVGGGDDDHGEGSIGATSVIIYACTVFMFTCNAITFIKLFRNTKKNNVLSDVESKKRMRRNKVLFGQKISQDSLYLVDMFTVQVLTKLSIEWWWLFLTNTLIWLSLNTIDGIVMILFSKELLDPILRVKRLIVVASSSGGESKEMFTKSRQSRAHSTAF